MTSRQRTILVLTHTAVLGGASRSLSLVIEHLVNLGCRVITLSPKGPSWGNWEAKGSEVLPWSPPVCAWLGKSMYSYVAEHSWDRIIYNLTDLLLLPLRIWRSQHLIGHFIKHENIDTIYVNSLTLFALAGTLGKIKKGTGVRVIWQIREVLNSDLPKWLYRSIANNIYKYSDQVVAISSNEAVPFDGKDKTVIVHNSVPIEWGSSPSRPDDEPGQKLRIAMSGAYRPSKGVNEFIAMAKIIKQTHPETEFYLYSPHLIPPKYRQIFRRIASILGLFSEKISLSLDLVEQLSSGVIKNSVNVIFDLPLTLEIYKSMSIYVRSDRSLSPWGRDVIEAMWAGVPIVATGTSQEFIIDGKTGFLVPESNAGLLAERVNMLIENSALRKSMSFESRKRARELFDPDMYKARLIKIFDI